MKTSHVAPSPTNVRRWENGRELRTVEVDPVRGPLMKWAVEEYATGEWSIRRLLDEVTERGLTSTGGPPTPSRPLSLNNFNRLLRTTYYYGVVTYRGVQYEGPRPTHLEGDLRPGPGDPGSEGALRREVAFEALEETETECRARTGLRGDASEVTCQVRPVVATYWVTARRMVQEMERSSSRAIRFTSEYKSSDILTITGCMGS